MPTSIPYGILIQPAVWPQQTWVKIRGCAPFGGWGAGFPSNTMWPGPRPISIPRIIIQPTVWPQYQRYRHDRQRSVSIRRTVSQTVAPKRFALCHGTVICLSCDVGVLWPNGLMDQDVTWYGRGPQPVRHCVRWSPSSPHGKGHSSHPTLQPMFTVAKRSPI